MGLVSEAGMPAVADPGSSVVRAAHDLGVAVVPLVGPVSLLLALAASGLNGQNFAFVGYLPQDTAERAQRIKTLESLALKTGQTQLFIETPYRNAALFQALLQTLQHNTRLAVCSGLTLASAQVHSRHVKALETGTGHEHQPANGLRHRPLTPLSVSGWPESLSALSPRLRRWRRQSASPAARPRSHGGCSPPGPRP